MCIIKCYEMFTLLVQPSPLLSKILHLGLFFIIDWFTDAPTLLFGKLNKKIKLKIPPILIFILIMDRKNKNNKNSALIPQ